LGSLKIYVEKLLHKSEPFNIHQPARQVVFIRYAAITIIADTGVRREAIKVIGCGKRRVNEPEFYL
jgi:hypothetical protein